ncbi:MAG: carboxymuconolactone decarboxylase family protein [Bacteroidota bacterium]
MNSTTELTDMVDAQTEANEILAVVERKFGFVPNLIKEMVTSPAVAQVYLSGQEAMAEASLANKEQQAVQLTVAAYNQCHYCTAAHGLLGKHAGISSEALQAIKSGGLPQDERLKALVSATRLLLEKRGWLNADELQSLFAEGIDRAQVYEIIALIGLKTISNYINHVAHTKVDPELKA